MDYFVDVNVVSEANVLKFGDFCSFTYGYNLIF